MKRSILLLLFSVPWAAIGQIPITVNPSNEHQVIQGFGAFGGIKPYWETPPFYTEPFLDYFLDDLGATIVRTNIFWDLEPVNDNNSPSDLDLSKFNYGPGSNLARQLPYYTALKDAGLKKLIATSWTPPDWMKLHDDEDRIPDQCYNCNNCSVSDPRRKVCGGRLDPRYYGEYAEYLMAYVMILKQQAGIDLYAISIQNEPYFANPFESNVVKPDEFGGLLNIVGRKFREHGLSTKIFGPEHMAEWSWGVQQNYVSNIFKGDQDNPYLDIYAVHGYVDGVAPDYGSAAGWTALKENITDHYDKPLWMTETSGYPQTMDGAMNLAKSMYLALRFGNISAWVYWSVSGDSGSEFAIMADGEPTILYHVSRQFFKFIRPGARRIDVSSGDAAVLALAFQNPSEGSMTIVLINTAEGERTVDLDIPGGPEEFSASRTSQVENSVSVGTVTYATSLPPKSITTLIGYGASGPRIDDIPNHFLRVGDNGSIEVPLTGIAAGHGNNLTIEVKSSDQSVVTNEQLIYSYPASEGTLVLSADTSVPGRSDITLKLFNGEALDESAFGFNATEVSFTVEIYGVVADVKEEQNETHWVYPNPVNFGNITINLPETPGRIILRILDIHGRVLIKRRFDESGKNQVTIDTRDWRSGEYIIQLDLGKKIISDKIIIK